MPFFTTSVVETNAHGKATATAVFTISIPTQRPSATSSSDKTSDRTSEKTSSSRNAQTTSSSADDGWGGWGPFPTGSGGPPPFVKSLIESEFAHDSTTSPAPTSTSQSSINATSNQSSGVSGGAVAGIVLGVVAVILFAIALVLVVLQRRAAARRGTSKRGNGGDGSSQRSLDGLGSDDVERQNAQGVPQGRLSRLLRWLGLDSRTPTGAGNSTRAPTSQGAELDHDEAALKELSDQAKSITELQSPGQKPSSVADTGHGTAPAVELLGEGHYHEVENSEIPFQSPSMQSPIDWSMYKAPIMETAVRNAASTTTDSDATAAAREYELDANPVSPSLKTQNLPQKPAQFPYPGLLLQNSDVRLA